MMIRLLEGIGYYLSCMILFNIIYALSLIGNGDVLEISCGNYNIAGIITLIIVTTLALLGIISTIKISKIDDSKTNKASTGKKIDITNVVDQTGENYFANFSVIVLTGIALPAKANWCVLAIVLLIELALGIVYIKNQMYYMNPILSLLNFNCYKCIGKVKNDSNTREEVYYFLTKGLEVKIGSTIEYINTNSHIIRLNMKKEDT